MTRRVWLGLAALLALAAGGAALFLRPPAKSERPSPPPVHTVAAPAPPPGGAADDVALAANHPDAFAWRVFLYLSRQADPARPGFADPSRPIGRYDPDTPVVWESWALASGVRATQEGSEVFREDGADPGPWGRWPRPARAPKILSSPLAFPFQPAVAETRLNEAAYQFIRAQGLYNREGLNTAFQRAVATTNPQPIAFPLAAQEIKAHWSNLGPAPAASVLATYHWRRIGRDYWGLVALHLTTKDLPDWFWADFQRLNTPAADAPREVAGTKWAYYHLTGAQTRFTDARGAPTVLSSEVIEAGFEHTSCMTCHARAAVRFGPRGLVHLKADSYYFDGDGHTPVADVDNPDVGIPDPALFGEPLAYAQTDFLWSIPLRVRPVRRPG